MLVKCCPRAALAAGTPWALPGTRRALPQLFPGWGRWGKYKPPKQRERVTARPTSKTSRGLTHREGGSRLSGSTNTAGTDSKRFPKANRALGWSLPPEGQGSLPGGGQSTRHT